MFAFYVFVFFMRCHSSQDSLEEDILYLNGTILLKQWLNCT